jgi:N-acetylneuraminic acid mutarotase
MAFLTSLPSMNSASGGWSRKTNMQTARYGLSTSVVNGKIYAIGGRAGGQFFSTVEEYDPATDTWTRKADMPTARVQLSTSVVDGKIYAIGGYNSGGPVASVEEYDPATDTWRTRADMPYTDYGLSTSVVDGKIYAMGGNTGVLTVNEYDPATNTWKEKTDMTKRRTELFTSVVDGKIYAIGGGEWDSTDRVMISFSTVEEYDPAADTWTPKADMPTARWGFSTSTLNGKIYAVGGSGADDVILSVVEEYDAATDTWAEMPAMPTARYRLSTSVVNDRIYAIGGQPGSWPTVSNAVEVYDFTPPPPDFNGDGIVDAVDMCIMVNNWGIDARLCDIDPMPWGDGIVDLRDLAVFAEFWLEDYRLIARWKLDETEGNIAHDNIGDNDGILHDAPVWQPASGKDTGAVQFDGINDYISTDFVLNPVAEPFSVFVWIKGGAPGQVIISQTGGTGQGNAWLCTDPSDGKLTTNLMLMHPVFLPLESEVVITDGQWHHIGLVYDRDVLHRHLYVDGAEVAEDTSFVGGVPSTGGLYFGTGEDLDESSFWSGLIDDVQIYDQALSAKEIEELVR